MISCTICLICADKYLTC